MIVQLRPHILIFPVEKLFNMSAVHAVVRQKKIIIKYPQNIYYRGVKYNIYCLPRPDVWFFSSSNSMQEAFEIWDFGQTSAEKYNNIYC